MLVFSRQDAFGERCEQLNVPGCSASAAPGGTERRETAAGMALVSRQ